MDGVNWRVVYFRKFLFCPMIRNSVLEELTVRRFAVIQEETCDGYSVGE